MEGVLVSATTGALDSVLGKLAALLGNEYEYLKEMHDEIRLLTHELAALHAFLFKMSEEEDPDMQDKVWMNEVRELSYDMEDSIDDFMQDFGDKDTKPDGFIEKMKNWLEKMKARRRIGNEIQGLKKQIIELGNRNERYKAGVAISSTKNATIDTRALAIFVHASELVGIYQPKAELIKLLTEEDGVASTQQQEVKMVSIVGSGGLGKTTLANQVYQELKEKFECRAFISVSRNPDMMSILKVILSEVSGRHYADTEAESIEQLIIKISDFLADRRYLIVVDDIWDVDTWNVIKLAFPRTNSSSRIITTTRINDVAHSCSLFGGHIYNIRPLSMEHSKQLFHRRLFNSEEDCPSYLQEISDQILEKCEGLPLAIIAISGLLANTKRTEDLWNQVKDSIGRALQRNPSVEGMMKILSLSYFDLPPHLKTCLLYLSVFPEDSVIRKQDLIRRWIAEEFIHNHNIYTRRELGDMCFNELVNRSLIQPVMNEYGKVKSCRVHDTILDFILSKSIEENFVTLAGAPTQTSQRKIRRLSLQVGEQDDLIPPEYQVFSHVRSLNVSRKMVKIPSLDKFRHLRVLDFGGCYWLESRHLENIGRLFQLRYLNLQGTTGVNKLPEQIGHLWCLEMLDLRNTTVHELPSCIVNLKRLVHLFIDSNVIFPCGIAKMQALETLKCVHVFKQPVNFLQELGQLQSLKKLVLNFETDSSICSIAEEEFKRAITAASLNNLQNILSLAVWNGPTFLGGSLCVPVSLQKLVTSGSVIMQVPKWVSSLANLQLLCLEMVVVRQKDICILGGLPALRILFLVIDSFSEAERSEDIRVTVSGQTGFPVLRMFSYLMPHRGMDLMFAVGAMPKLDKLEIAFDANKTGSVSTSCGAFDFGVENLPCLVTVRCVVVGDNNSVDTAKAAMERAASIHLNQPTLLFVEV